MTAKAVLTLATLVALVPLPCSADGIDDLIREELDANTEQARSLTGRVSYDTDVVTGGVLELAVIDPLYSAPHRPLRVVVPKGATVVCRFTGRMGVSRAEVMCGTIIFPDNRQAEIVGLLQDPNGAGLPFKRDRRVAKGHIATIMLGK